MPRGAGRGGKDRPQFGCFLQEPRQFGRVYELRPFDELQPAKAFVGFVSDDPDARRELRMRSPAARTAIVHISEPGTENQAIQRIGDGQWAANLPRKRRLPAELRAVTVPRGARRGRKDRTEFCGFLNQPRKLWSVNQFRTVDKLQPAQTLIRFVCHDSSTRCELRMRSSTTRTAIVHRNRS